MTRRTRTTEVIALFTLAWVVLFGCSETGSSATSAALPLQDRLSRDLESIISRTNSIQHAPAYEQYRHEKLVQFLSSANTESLKAETLVAVTARPLLPDGEGELVIDTVGSHPNSTGVMILVGSDTVDLPFPSVYLESNERASIESVTFTYAFNSKHQPSIKPVIARILNGEPAYCQLVPKSGELSDRLVIEPF